MRAAENVFREAVPLGDTGKHRATQIAEVLRFEKSVVRWACPSELFKETRASGAGRENLNEGIFP